MMKKNNGKFVTSFQTIINQIHDNSIIGLGSGETISKFLEFLSQSSLSISVIPSSLQIKHKAETLNLNICSDKYIPSIDITIDSADQILDSYDVMIKGGGGALVKEKILIRASKKTVIIADQNKFVKKFNIPIPIEIIPYSYYTVKNFLNKIGGTANLRYINNKNYPYITDNSNFILDTSFEKLLDVKKLDQILLSIPGVIDSGIFIENIASFFKILSTGKIDEIKVIDD